jgi:hypothetical protein
VQLPQLLEDADEVHILLLHFLMVAPALLGLPGADEDLHSLENLVHSPHVPIHKVPIVYLQKPMIFFILVGRPMPPIHIFEILLTFSTPLASFLGKRADTGDAQILLGVGLLLELHDRIKRLRRGSGRERVRGRKGVLLPSLLSR